MGGGICFAKYESEQTVSSPSICIDNATYFGDQRVLKNTRRWAARGRDCPEENVRHSIL